MRDQSPLSSSVGDLVFDISRTLVRVFLGIQESLHIDIDPQTAIRSVQVVREQVRTPEAMHRMAVLQSFFSYTLQAKIDSIPIG
jgi:hypothetical protein